MFYKRHRILALVIGLLSITASPALAGWGKAQLIGRGIYGSLAVDSAGISHIVYVRSASGAGVDLLYVTYNLLYVTYNQHRARSSILVTHLGLGVLGGAAIAIDSHNVPHVALITYPPGGPFQLDYLDLEGNQWHAQTVDPSTFGEAFQVANSPLALDSNDHPHIAYIGADGSLAHASSSDGSTWQIEDTGLSVDPSSIQVGGDGTVHVAGLNTQTDQVCEERGLNGTWTGECFDDGTFQDIPAVALAPDGTPEVVDGDISTLKLAHFDGSNWSIQTVAGALELSVNGLYSTAFALDPAGLAKVMFVGEGKHEDLFYAAQQGNIFALTDLGGANFGLNNISLGLDPAGLTHTTLWASTEAGGFQLYAALTLPDLTGQWLSVTPKVASGGTVISGQLQVNNLGTAPAAGFTLNYYLSADDQLDQTDELLGHGSVGVGAGQHKAVIFASHLLPGSVSGEYLIASISSKNPQNEANTANNNAAIQIP